MPVATVTVAHSRTYSEAAYSRERASPWGTVLRLPEYSASWSTMLAPVREDRAYVGKVLDLCQLPPSPRFYEGSLSTGGLVSGEPGW